MNDLIAKITPTNKVSNYVDLKRDNMRDLEMGPGEAGGGAGIASASVAQQQNLAAFFEEVNMVKQEMEKVKPLLCRLQEANEESRRIQKAKALKSLRTRMDDDVVKVLRTVKAIKAKLEDLDKGNVANRQIPGCEEGTPTDRTRTSITNALRKKLKDLMGDFQKLREKMIGEYKETIERRYYTITGQKADEETVDRMMETGESENFLHKAIQEQGKGCMVEALKEIQERHDAVKEVERSLLELHQIFLDMAVLVEKQGEHLNNIEHQVHNASSYVNHGTNHIHIAKKYQRSTRKCMCIAIMLFLFLISHQLLCPLLLASLKNVLVERENRLL